MLETQKLEMVRKLKAQGVSSEVITAEAGLDLAEIEVIKYKTEADCGASFLQSAVYYYLGNMGTIFPE